MATWVVGDVHGCAAELAELVERIGPGEGDRLVAVGDLFHRGPDPVGVMEILTAVRARFVLGNHEWSVLRRVGLAPTSADPAHRPPRRESFPPLEAGDLLGDGSRPCPVPAERRADLLRFLQDHAGFFLRSSEVEGAAPTPDGRDWVVVHAAVDPRRPLEGTPIDTLMRRRRIDGPGRPWWYEAYRGPRLVLFGHTHAARPRAHHADGALVALGLDTGCVYGGALTAYSPELDELISVPATRAYAGAH
jgi:serine/threonine protein phosphatase 1